MGLVLVGPCQPPTVASTTFRLLLLAGCLLKASLSLLYPGGPDQLSQIPLRPWMVGDRRQLRPDDV